MSKVVREKEGFNKENLSDLLDMSEISKVTPTLTLKERKAHM